MLLTVTEVRNAKPDAKTYRLKDGNGLFLQVEPKGGKYWRFRYHYAGKEKMLALGTYPEVSLLEAREKGLASRKLIAGGLDPSSKKKEEKRQSVLNAANTFRAIAQEWHESNKAKWVPSHAEKIMRRMEVHLFPAIGDRPIKEIKPMEVLEALRKIEKKGATHQSHRAHQVCSTVFRYAIATGRADYNAAADLRGALRAHKTKNYPTIEAKEIPDFLEKLEEANTSPHNKLAIKILLHTFVRQGELRQAKWEDIDFDKKEWCLPAETTKMKTDHLVPLASQTIALLKQLQELTGFSPYLLPAQARQKSQVICENTLNLVLHKMGYKDKLVGHGFRALASTTLNEQGFPPDVIERQLAHIQRNKVRAAYNRAEYMPQRREMMQWWADYILHCTKERSSPHLAIVEIAS